jgi:hypothetical protein
VENTMGVWKEFSKIKLRWHKIEGFLCVYPKYYGVWKVFAKKCDDSTYQSINLKD